MTQRQDFVQEIEGRLKGLKTEKITPTFKAAEEIRSFNFENELERLKRTLSDIRDQECRFMKLLSKKSPIKEHKTEILSQSQPQQVAGQPEQREQREPRYEPTEIQPQVQKFEDLVEKDFGNEDIELTDSKPSDAYCDESAILKQSFSNSNIVERRHNQRKSSLKKRKNDSQDNLRSSYSNRSL